jgi:hypothetical protein
MAANWLTPAGISNIISIVLENDHIRQLLLLRKLKDPKRQKTAQTDFFHIYRREDLKEDK